MNAYKTPLQREHGIVGLIPYLTTYDETSYERYFGSNLFGFSGGYEHAVQMMFYGVVSGSVVVKDIKREAYETE